MVRKLVESLVIESIYSGCAGVQKLLSTRYIAKEALNMATAPKCTFVGSFGAMARYWT